MYLQRRNGVYWFRKAVPLNLVAVLGQAEIRVSLRTHRRDEAKQKASVMQVALETVYAVLRAENPLEPATALLGSFLQDFSAHTAASSEATYDAALQNIQHVADTLSVPARFAPSDETLVDIDHIDPLLSREQPRGEANSTAVDLLQLAMRIRRERGWSRTSRLQALISLCQKVAAAGDSISLDTPRGLQAIRAIIREEVERAGVGTIIQQAPSFDAASFKEIVAGEVRAGIASAGRDRWSAELLSVMIGKFLEAQYPADGSPQKTANKQRKVGSKHRNDVERRLAAFLAFSGDKAVRDVTRDDLKSYRDVLDQLPDRFELRLRTKDMRLATEKNVALKAPFPTIGPITVNLKWLGPVDRLFDWLVLEEKVEKNPVDGVRSTQESGEAANTKRLPFKPEQISKLFAITSASSPKSALYWLPLLMLATGARPNELAQLQPDDLDLTFNGRPHLNVLCLLDDDDDAADPAETEKVTDDSRRVKTAAGRRMIPLHPILIEVGFIRFVEERRNLSAKKLFRELRPDQHGFWSSAITKRLNRIIRDKLNITNPKYSAYSLRHTFIDACRTANIEEGTRMKFVGHQLGGVHGIYGNPRARPDESPLIDLIRFDGVDFGSYRTM
jgi:integrase